MSKFSNLLTPACLIDLPRLIANADRMAAVADVAGVALRPHVKTLKSLEAAQIYAPLPMPITVSTLAEGRAFAEAGYSDILYAVGLTPNKLPAVNALLENNISLTVLIDSSAAAEALADSADNLSGTLNVAVEVDTDGHRAGIGAESPVLLQIAAKLAGSSKLNLVGVMAHAGGSYGAFDSEARQHSAQQECDKALLASARLEEAGFPVTMISVGSTPTALSGITHEGITELRAGVYATFDCVMAGLGVCQYQDIAISVLTSVIGRQDEKGWVLVDAGWMALSRDTGTASHPTDCGYGLVCDVHGNLLDGWYVQQTNQEHGVIVHRDGHTPTEQNFSYGTMLRILPVHACATAGQFEKYHVTRDNVHTQETWNRINGW
ncbi:alanine racemase [Salinimonas chungwhensis]|uniref:alanine racemase n=1 Tax=Salinimonas chungwhensis TaxID=265425 RepID=UPI0003616C09|nr:alanine racemase [Salinimonas chungwhensis]